MAYPQPQKKERYWESIDKKNMKKLLYHYMGEQETVEEVYPDIKFKGKSNPDWRQIAPFYLAMGFPRKLPIFGTWEVKSKIESYVEAYWGQYPTLDDLCDYFHLDIDEVMYQWKEFGGSGDSSYASGTGSYQDTEDDYNPSWQNENGNYFDSFRNGIKDAVFTEKQNSSVNRRQLDNRVRNQRRNAYQYNSAGSSSASGAEDKDIGGTIGTIVFIVIALFILAKTGIFSAFMSSFGSIFRFVGTLCMIAGVVMLAAGFLGNKLSKQEAERNFGLIIFGANLNALTQEFELIWLVAAGIGGLLIYCGCKN